MTAGAEHPNTEHRNTEHRNTEHRNTGPVDRLRARYARLLLAYPKDYRERRGEELLDTLTELAAPGQRRPCWRQAASMVLAGLRARAKVDRPATAGQVWLRGVHLAIAIALGIGVGGAVANQITRAEAREGQSMALLVVADVVAIAIVAALAAGRPRLALLLSLVALTNTAVLITPHGPFMNMTILQSLLLTGGLTLVSRPSSLKPSTATTVGTFLVAATFGATRALAISPLTTAVAVIGFTGGVLIWGLFVDAGFLPALALVTTIVLASGLTVAAGTGYWEEMSPQLVAIGTLTAFAFCAGWRRSRQQAKL